MNIKYWDGGLERHEIDAIKKIENVLTNSICHKVQDKNKNQKLNSSKVLKKSFNEGWKGYAGFRFINKNKQGEIDLLIVTHCNILIVELKHWNGKPITSNRGKWFWGNEDRGKSPVEVTRNKEFLLKNLLKPFAKKFKNEGRVPHVHFLVVMSGDSDFSGINVSDLAHTITLKEFSQLCVDEHKFNKRFTPHPNAKVLLQDIPLLEKSLLLNDQKVEARPLSVDGWLGQEQIFEHPNQVYKEYFAQSVADKNDRAIIRSWDFDKLSNYDAKTPDGRIKIASREREVLTKIRRENRRLYEHCVSSLTIPTKDKITSQYNEVVELPHGHERLNDFIATYGGNLSIDERINLVKVLVARFADLHQLQLAHRDIGKHSIWLSTGQRVALSNFISAFDRKKETVGNIRDELSVYNQTTPSLSPYQNDVSRLAVIAWAIIKAKRLTPVFEKELLNQISQCTEWYGDTLLNAFKGEGFNNASDLLDALAKQEPSKEEAFSFSTKELERFVRPSKIGRLHPEVEFISESDLKEVYRSDNGVVKVWNNINPTEINTGLGLRTLSFLERVEKLQSLNLSFIPTIADYGITARDCSLYLVSEWIEGEPLDPYRMRNRRHDIINSLVAHIEHMHSLGFAHGDLKPENILVDKHCDVFIIDVLDFHHDAEELFNTEYSPVDAPNCSAFVRDNYAVMKVSSELLGIDWGFESLHFEAISKAIIHELEDVDFGFRELTRFKDAVLNPEKILQPSVEIIDIEIGGAKDGFEPLIVYPDNGKLYVSIEESSNNASGLVMSVYGLGGFFRLFFNQVSFAFEHGLAPKKRDSIFPRDIEKAALELPFAIRVSQGRASNLEALNRRVRQIYSFENAIKQFQLKQRKIEPLLIDKTVDIVNVELNVKPISTRELWQAILKTETESHPYVELTGEPSAYKDNKDILILSYEAEKDPLDGFTAKDQVEAIIVDGEEDYFIGEVNLSASGLNRVNLSRFSSRANKLKEEDIIFFRSKADKSSFNKRKNALTRILDKDSVIENLSDYFEPDCGLLPIDYDLTVTDEDFERYDREDDNGNVIKLNDKQRVAFQKLLKYGPLSMLQGPPGTGKTEFIAAFVHYLIEKQGAERILLVSQSHEAVNTAAERIRKHCDRLKTDLDVVRFSRSESTISHSLRDAYSNNIVSQKVEQFETQLKYRVLNLAKSLKAPTDYLEAYLILDKQILSHIANQKNALIAIDDKELLTKQKKVLKKEIGERKSLINSRLPQKIRSNKDWHDNLDEVCIDLVEGLNHEYAIEENTFSLVQRIVALSKDMIRIMQSGNANMDEFLARSKQLVAGTCVGIGNWDIDIASNQYDWIIIDEAARSIASELAIAMQVGKRVLLVGDHKQLPPLYTDPHKKALARHLGIQTSNDIDELIESDFARAFESEYGEQVGAKLLVQYRMAPAIGTLVSKCFYDGELENGERNIPDIYRDVPMVMSSTTTWLDTSSLGKKAHHQSGSGRSIYNDAEADAIVDLLRQIDKDESFINSLFEQVKDGEAAIGVICMYAEQKRILRQKVKKASLSDELMKLLKIDTVDSYQGKENRVIILSVTRSEQKQSPGFLKLPNRINVGLSRAMDRLVIVGDKRMWQGKNSQLPFGKVIKFMEENTNEDLYRFVDAVTKKFKKAV
ncbi:MULTISPECIES: AAA domain-containing protein [Aliivibrio]|uniref:DNA helicase n=1 Tax=Aliivibrio finisterrensis TaxID=511998 RepID=A0A4Q5KPI0_9GAMM|nr:MULTISPECIES: AAA domain-containing protein [Aliivibrio]MDD9198591.1 AAA domain-containing protein [Aliivibrio sp. S2MY1]RYU47425.1 DNA helicase [Aliivibrio finisterrensis]RYU48262.1 DNA helicase [Aliivibrio finisterrensis]